MLFVTLTDAILLLYTPGIPHRYNKDCLFPSCEEEKPAAERPASQNSHLDLNGNIKSIICYGAKQNLLATHTTYLEWTFDCVYRLLQLFQLRCHCDEEWLESTS